MQSKSTWLESTREGVVIRLQIQPKASKTEIVGLHGDPPRLKVRVAAPPVEGEANEELLRFLKKRLRIPSSQLRIIRGESSKMKDILCSGAKADEIEKLLG